MTRPWQTLDTVPTREGLLELRRRGDSEFLITIAGRVLMTSTARRSEEALARLACAELAGHTAPHVLIGGLGMGYTLRAALDALPARARVRVVELTPEVVSWCRGPLARLTAGAMLDARVEVEVGDVAHAIRAAQPGSWHAVVLDLYEGPHASTQRPDDPFYGARALSRAHAALAAGGVLAVWSEEPDAPFARRLGAAGFTTRVHRAGRGGRSHVVYVGVKTGG
jgi:spermidine synthase